ncbi:MAG: hypothetical protein ACKVP4_05140 [Hyphomicrobium sp.]
MRKLLMALAMVGGVALAGAGPASANAAAGLAVKPNAGVTVPSQVDQVRSYRRHRGWRRGRGLSLGFGYPGIYGFYGYPNYGYRRHYYRPYYYSGYRPYYRRRHHRRWRNHW